MMAFAKHAKEFVGQKVAVLCGRYQYRGLLSEVTDEFLVLANATAVEISGVSSAAAPNTEDPIHGSITIMSRAVELFYQPNWSQAPLPGER